MKREKNEPSRNDDALDTLVNELQEAAFDFGQRMGQREATTMERLAATIEATADLLRRLAGQVGPLDLFARDVIKPPQGVTRPETLGALLEAIGKALATALDAIRRALAEAHAEGGAA